MPPRRRLAAPPIDVDDLRSRLDEGKIVRVAIARSAQFPTGSVGRVRRIGDPATDGEEFIHVELSLNGAKDVLPFAPADLATPTRGATANGSATNGSASNGSASNGTASNGTASNGSAGHSPPTAVAPSGPDRIAFRELILPTDIGGPVRPPRPEPEPAPASPSAAVPTPPAPARPKATGQSSVKPAAKSAAKRRSPAVAISIATTDADPPQWRIEAKVGAKVVLRQGSVPPARVWELVGMLGDHTLSRAVGAVLDEQRQAAQARADALAAELAQVQAELAGLPEPGPRGPES